MLGKGMGKIKCWKSWDLGMAKFCGYVGGGVEFAIGSVSGGGGGGGWLINIWTMVHVLLAIREVL